MKNLLFKKFISEIEDEFGDDRFIYGDCLNLAVALHNTLTELDIESHVIKYNEKMAILQKNFGVKL